MHNKTLKEMLCTFLSGLFFGTLLTFVALGAFATAFSLHQPATGNSFYRALDLHKLFRVTVCFSLIFSALFTIKKLWIIAPILLVGYLTLGWYFGDLRDCTLDFIYIISKRYDNGYGCGVLMLKGERPIYSDIFVVFRSVAALGAMIITWATCKRQSSYWVLFFSLLCFAPCCALTNTVPGAKYLFLWILGLMLFLITNYTRKSDPKKSLILSLAYIVPISLILILLFTFVPKEGYEGQGRADHWRETLEEMFLFADSNAPGTGAQAAKTIDLSSLTDRKERNVPVMYVTASESGAYYLRGEVYSTYTGTQWIADDSVGTLPWADSFPTEETLSIRTRFEHDMCYVPYCADPAILSEGDLGLKNPEGLKEYSYTCYTTDETNFHPTTFSTSDLFSWTVLPPSTEEWASKIAAELNNTPGRYIDLVRSYISSTAVYDLSPDSMEPPYTDFAQWFIEEGESGYCVHFATAATILMRAGGYPARYVTGYLIEAQAEKETTVYQKHAHAWVEYWTIADGWQVLEATPPREVEETTNGSVESLETTLGESTEQITESTKPTITENTQEPEETSQAADPEASENTSSPADSTDSSKLHKILIGLLKWFLIIGSSVGLMIGQRALRIFLRERKATLSSNHDRALLYWNHSLKYSKILKKKPDQKLKRIAEKAKFSNHDITDQDLEVYGRFFRNAKSEIRKLSFFRRFYGKWFLAL